MKKRYKLNENGKYALGILVSIIILIVCTVLYMDRVKQINNGDMKVTNNSEMEK